MRAHPGDSAKLRASKSARHGRLSSWKACNAYRAERRKLGCLRSAGFHGSGNPRRSISSFDLGKVNEKNLS